MKNQDLSVLKALLLREMDGGMCQECGGMMYEGMCQECGWMEEALHGGQKKLDVAKPFGKLTGADFKALRAKKGMEEGGMEDSEARIAHMQKDYKEMYNLGYTTGYADAQRGSKPNPMNENEDSVMHFNSAENEQDWIYKFYSALNAELENEPELKAKAQEALEI
ncbi:MAG: hypothetical protein EBZ47_09815, partial [Chlamydiae bacterium]|nr:hypothetical protein [Chlamydiota bacterium]